MKYVFKLTSIRCTTRLIPWVLKTLSYCSSIMKVYAYTIFFTRKGRGKKPFGLYSTVSYFINELHFYYKKRYL